MVRSSVNNGLSRGMATGETPSLGSSELFRRPRSRARVFYSVRSHSANGIVVETVGENCILLVHNLSNVPWLAIRMIAEDCLQMCSNVLIEDIDWQGGSCRMEC